ncbi:uncharacterized protein LOC109489924 [Ailuropoda melanoleuca]|uniref:uncharacterized protein LOC109489924 n=1 Tax=Ailuropoda melanoleuca TaxID=9646 RepID=UPI001494DEEB|nr:uncharacterized protein LOC109489924 [Ailuropoda melanoleuca]
MGGASSRAARAGKGRLRRLPAASRGHRPDPAPAACVQVSPGPLSSRRDAGVLGAPEALLLRRVRTMGRFEEQKSRSPLWDSSNRGLGQTFGERLVQLLGVLVPSVARRLRPVGEALAGEKFQTGSRWGFVFLFQPRSTPGGRMCSREPGRVWARASAEALMPGAGEAGPLAATGLHPGACWNDWPPFSCRPDLTLTQGISCCGKG